MRELALRGRAYPTDLNHSGNVFGGFIMSKMDKAASIAVDSIITSNAVTISVSNLLFKKPVHNGDIFTIYTEVIKVGITSITIYVDVEVKCHKSNEQYSVTDAQFKFVAINKEGKSIPIKDVARENIDDSITALIKNNK